MTTRLVSTITKSMGKTIEFKETYYTIIIPSSIIRRFSDDLRRLFGISKELLQMNRKRIERDIRLKCLAKRHLRRKWEKWTQQRKRKRKKETVNGISATCNRCPRAFSRSLSTVIFVSSSGRSLLANVATPNKGKMT